MYCTSYGSLPFSSGGLSKVAFCFVVVCEVTLRRRLRIVPAFCCCIPVVLIAVLDGFACLVLSLLRAPPSVLDYVVSLRAAFHSCSGLPSQDELFDGPGPGAEVFPSFPEPFSLPSVSLVALSISFSLGRVSVYA